MLWYIGLKLHTHEWKNVTKQERVNFRWRQCQYLLWSPGAANTVLHLLGTDRIKFCIRSCGILCHSCCTYWLSWSNDWDGGWCWRTPLPNSSERCSMGFKSGDFEGHGNTWMLFRMRKSNDTLAAWGGQKYSIRVYISSCNINKGNNKITELRTILQRESQNS